MYAVECRPIASYNQQRPRDEYPTGERPEALYLRVGACAHDVTVISCCPNPLTNICLHHFRPPGTEVIAW